jgi:predicted transcriptional regulator
MQALWKASGWVTVHDIRDRMDYHRPVAYSTVATVVGNLCDKGLVRRELGDRTEHPGSGVWWYRAARPETEHIGELIATLLDHSPSPAAALAHALATARTAIQINEDVIWMAVSACSEGG